MLDSSTQASIAAIVADRTVTSLYQPILDLVTREVVGYEALARGPVGSDLEFPDAMFAAADGAGLRWALDWECRAAALRGAIEKGLGRESCLFINLEATSFGGGAPGHLVEEIRAAAAHLNVVAEITERDLTLDPASLLQGIGALRELGFGIAIDDCGANPETLALLPFLEPDVIKLDMSLVQATATETVAALSAAVRSDAERRGTMIIAEGIESDEHLQRADVLGATHGQGWLFGRPAPLPPPTAGSGTTSAFWEKLPRDYHDAPETPWSLVSDAVDLRVASKALLLPMSMLIEQHPTPAHERRVIMSAFQHARNFTGATTRRYAELAEQATFIGVLGEGFTDAPVPGVRGGHIEAGHPLCGEWTVINVGPHYAAALIAKDLGDDGPEPDRRFLYSITHDREKVVSAAASLLRLIDPLHVDPLAAPSGLEQPQRRSTDRG